MAVDLLVDREGMFYIKGEGGGGVWGGEKPPQSRVLCSFVKTEVFGGVCFEYPTKGVVSVVF